MVPTIPRSSIAWLVDRHHIGPDPAIVAQDIRSRCERAGADPAVTARSVRYATMRHRANGGRYRYIMGGMR